MKSTYYDYTFDGFVDNKDVEWTGRNLLPIAVKNLVPKSWDTLHSNTDLFEKFRVAQEFVQWNIPESIGLHALSFLSLEIQSILYRSIFLATMSFYKEATGNLRSALELTHFVSVRITDKEDGLDPNTLLKKFLDEAKVDADWIMSKGSVPYRKELKRKSKTNPVVSGLMQVSDFEAELDSLYGDLDELLHTNGFSKTNFDIHKNSGNLLAPPSFNESTLSLFARLYIRTVEIVAILLVCMSPQLINEELSYQIEMQTGEPILGNGVWGNASKTFFDEKGSGLLLTLVILWSRTLFQN